MESLLDLPHQPPLPLDLDAEEAHDAAAIAQAPRNPIFSGDRLYKADPARYRLFCRLFFESGLGQMESCRLLGMSPQSGAAVIAREQASMSAADLRRVQAARARAVVSLALSAMQERLADPEALAAVPLRDIAQAAQRAQEIAALLSGEATSRVGRPDEMRRVADDAAEYLDAVQCPQQSVCRGEIAGSRERVQDELVAGSEASTEGLVDSESSGLSGDRVEAQAVMTPAALVAAQDGGATGG
jgi:hypothetical protein